MNTVGGMNMFQWGLILLIIAVVLFGLERMGIPTKGRFFGLSILCLAVGGLFLIVSILGS